MPNNSHNNIELSVVIPLYKCSGTLEELCDRLLLVFKKLNKEFEIILVNDASPENDWEIASKLSKTNKNIKSINLSRNFGQQTAIFCGLENAKGHWIVVMDGDLQDLPEEIEKLYEQTHSKFDIILARRHHRKDKFFKKLSSYLFYKMLTFLTDKKFDPAVGNFGLYHNNVINAVLSMGDQMKFFYLMISWVGFKTTKVDVIHSPRKVGKTSYNIRSLFHLAFTGIISFSNKPLRIVIKFGFILVFISFLMIAYYLYQYFQGKIIVLGYASTIVSLWFLTGCIISILGVIGTYLGSIFEKVKDRPTYIVKEVIN